ncbi:MAG: SAM-dependent methyltransferase [Actinomycetota bacterium]|nr:SAM-dependent methyltransferase [Actinomycetota bacterium]
MIDDAAAMRPGLDTTVSHSARIWNYWLGGKDNISQVVSAVPHSAPTVTVQARQAYYSKILAFTVQGVSGACMGVNVCFVGRGFLTAA